MPIIISNECLLDEEEGLYRYSVRINRQAPVAYFIHKRSEGLSTCLALAAKAVNMALEDDRILGGDTT